MDSKSCFDVLAPSVTEMVALLSGHVPENWTAAIVISLLKNLDLIFGVQKFPSSQ